MKTRSLGVMVSIGGFAGILAEIFFGEYCRALSPIGSAYIKSPAVGRFPLPHLLAEGIVWDFF